ncbi:MAG TPA: CocE/NonD family hydrolase, partial [Acidimicrobiales bacterium]|nr:CocE/NonD family hydrolase [Acidimicrobiales bacterium]
METDHTATWSDGESVRLRIVRPTGGTGCPGKPTAGWPLIVYMHGYTADRCENMSFASRSTMASWGYAVLSFNGRGGPSAGASACGQLSDAEDGLDDNGRDYTGPRDKLDISELIDWVRDNYAPTGCTSNCVNTSAVGLTGFSYGGMRALMMGVGSAANPQFDARVDAIAPVAGGMNWDKVP